MTAAGRTALADAAWDIPAAAVTARGWYRDARGTLGWFCDYVTDPVGRLDAPGVGAVLAVSVATEVRNDCRWFTTPAEAIAWIEGQH